VWHTFQAPLKEIWRIGVEQEKDAKAPLQRSADLLYCPVNVRSSAYPFPSLLIADDCPQYNRGSLSI